jgi:hypothetical protein
MLKKTITYTDYNDNQRTEEFYFNLTKAEIAEMELSTVGGLTQLLRGMIAAQDMPAIVKFVKELILNSYGKKSPDGKRFIKSPELSEEFMQTEAYSILFMELSTDADATSDFVNGILPADVRAQAEAEMKKEKEKLLGEAN